MHAHVTVYLGALLCRVDKHPHFEEQQLQQQKLVSRQGELPAIGTGLVSRTVSCDGAASPSSVSGMAPRNPFAGRVDKLYLVLISLHGLVRGQNMELGKDADTGGQVRTLQIGSRATNWVDCQLILPGRYEMSASWNVALVMWCWGTRLAGIANRVVPCVQHGAQQ